MKKSELKTGMIVETRNGDKYLVMRDPEEEGRELIRFDGGYMPLEEYNDDLYLKDDDDLDLKVQQGFDVVKIYSVGASICNLFGGDIPGGKLNLRLIWERPKLILDEVERKYLRAVINPLKSRVDFICKHIYGEDSEYIHIEFKESPYMMMFPTFKMGSMYKGMMLEKRYTLEELGL